MARAMPVISISRPRKTNRGTESRIRCAIPSSIAPDHDHIRGVGCEDDEAEGGEAKGEGDRHGGKHHRPDQPDEENE